VTRVAVHGAAGRMGKSIIAVLREEPRAALVAEVDRALTGATPIEDALASCDVVIDFSSPEGTKELVHACVATKRAAVIGTTGLDAEAGAAIDALARVAPVVVAPNMSVGVTALFWLAARAVELLGEEFDAEIVEMHHRHKVDAPSGTAVKLADVVARARGLDPKSAAKHGRSGQVGARTRDEIGVLALRGGDVVGDHTLVLAGPGERIELTHRAHSREIFARGAVRAALWVAERAPGRYDMGDVIGVKR
jgi:4-hydroxy-tetrahydrodipicolinate reductase